MTQQKIYRASERNMGGVLFPKNKLKLSINRKKSGIRKPVQFTILGYKFVPKYQKGDKLKYQPTGVTDKSWQALKRSLKLITKKTAPQYS